MTREEYGRVHAAASRVWEAAGRIRSETIRKEIRADAVMIMVAVEEVIGTVLRPKGAR